MPNFEFFGFGENRTKCLIETIKEKIEISDKVSPILCDVIFTNHKTVVRNARNINAPYVRLTSTLKDELTDLIEILHELNVDVEVMILDKFIPAKLSYKEE